MPTALVTGAAGFIGSNLAEALLDRGYRVRGVDNFATGRRSNLEPLSPREEFSFREADIRDADAMADAVAGVDSLFHQAAVASVPRSVEDPVTTTDANCTGTATVLDAARRADVDTAVVASSSSVYGSSEQLPKVETMPETPESPYALSKYFTEELALEFSDFYDIDTVALRYFNIFGPRQDPKGQYAAVIPKFIALMLDGDRPVIFGDGEQSRDFTYVDNAVQANVLAAEGNVTGEAFNVGTGGRVTVNGLVDALNEQLGTDLDPVYDDPRPGDVRHSHADVSKAAELLGYEPGVGFEEGLARTVGFFESAGGE
jgi:nucleoside-diphosphate-sugar epimerase